MADTSIETFAGGTDKPKLLSREEIAYTPAQRAAIMAAELADGDWRVVQAMEEFLAQNAPELLTKHGIDREKREAKRATIRSAR